MPYPADTYIECPVCKKKIYNYWEETHLDVMGTFYFGEPDIDAFIETGNMVFDKKNSWFAKHQSAWKVLCGEPIRIDYAKMPHQMQEWLIKNPSKFIQAVLDLYWFKFYDDCEASDPPVSKEDITAKLYNLPDDILLAIPQIPLPKNARKLAKVDCMIIASKNPFSEFIKKTFVCGFCNKETETDGNDLTLCRHCSRKGLMELDPDKSVMIPCQKIIIQENRLGQIANPFRTQLVLRGHTIDDFDPDKRKYVAGNEALITLIPRLHYNAPKKEIICDPQVLDVEIVKRSFEELTEIPKETVEKIKNLHKSSENPICNLVEQDGKTTLIAGDLLQSFCPEIYGMWTLKLALMLQLYSGSKESDIKRDNIHILMIGDPACISGDSRVVLQDGTLPEIKSLGEHHLQDIDVPVYSAKGSGKCAYAKQFHIYNKQPVYELITESGKRLVGTYNQKLLSVKKTGELKFKQIWKRMDELKEGDKVRVIPKIRCYKTNSPISKELAGLYGYKLADGWNRKNGYAVGFVVNNEEKDLIPKLQSMLSKEFGKEASVLERKTTPFAGVKKNHKAVPLYYLTVHSKDISTIFNDEIEKLFQSSNDVVAEALSWFFEGDGHVLTGGRGRYGVFAKQSADGLELLRSLQLLLLRFGIHSIVSMSKEENNPFLGKARCSLLKIRRANSIKRFARHIGFQSKKKKDKMKKLLEKISEQSTQQQRKDKVFEKVKTIRPYGYAKVYDLA